MTANRNVAFHRLHNQSDDENDDSDCNTINHNQHSRQLPLCSSSAWFPPSAEDDPIAEGITGKIPHAKSDFLSAMGNFSVQYNLSSASVAVAIMSSSGVYPEPAWAKFVLLGMVFAGAVLGMCVMGYLGDFIGRRKALIVTLLLTVLGSAGSALLPWGHDMDVVFGILSLCRFVLGVGVGGIYPLSAVTSSEKAVDGEHVSSRVGWAFFWQTPGAMFPYLLALLLLQFRGREAVDVQFRLLMGLGAVPAAMVLYAAFQHEDSAKFQQAQTSAPLRDAWEKRALYWRLFLGAAGSWFIYDVAFYGINTFTPDIIESIFGEESLTNLCWQSLVAQAIGVPGCIWAIMLLKTRGIYFLNFFGFFLLALIFAALAVIYQVDPEGQAEMKFVLYCFLMFALNFGPNVGTYVLPTVCFPSQVRSIFHGLSAASAKIGAVMGTFIFKPVERQAGVSGVLWLQVVLCLLGVGITFAFVPKDSPERIKDVQKELDNEWIAMNVSQELSTGLSSNNFGGSGNAENNDRGTASYTATDEGRDTLLGANKIQEEGNYPLDESTNQHSRLCITEL